MTHSHAANCSTSTATRSTTTPAQIIGSLVLRVAYDEPAATRTMITRARVADFQHLVLSLPAPYPDRVAQWVAEALINPNSA